MIKDPLTGAIIKQAQYVHSVLGPGYLESIYHTALFRRLQKAGMNVASQSPLPVHFDDEIIGNFIVDLLVEDLVVLELKAVSNLNTAHEVQLVSYLTALRLDVGLLINFGGESLQVKRKFRNPPADSLREEEALYSPPVNLVNPV
jgi:GxxExxY protein